MRRSSRRMASCCAGWASRSAAPNPTRSAARSNRGGCRSPAPSQPPGSIEGGDVIWLDERTVAVGRGYRTNDEGIRQFRGLLGDAIDEFIVVPLPHWRGAGDVFHLMSIISPGRSRSGGRVFAADAGAVSRDACGARACSSSKCRTQEFDSMGANVLAHRPRASA